MGLFVNATDFVGKYQLAIDLDSDDTVDDYIDKYEEAYLKKLMGAALFVLFKASIVAGLPTGVYLILYDPFDIDDVDGSACCGAQDVDDTLRTSIGIKEMLICFIWFEYVREQKYKHHKSGIIADVGENSREVPFDEANIYSKYNRGVETYENIQWLIKENEDDYPEYNGQKLEISHWAL